MHFHKYQALGNDYIVIVPAPGDPPVDRKLVQQVCDRHYGVGADGVLLRDAVDERRFVLRIFNPDGSEAEKSGNGIRIFARYLWDCGWVDERSFEIVTKSGPVQCEVRDGGRSVHVAMGRVTFDSAQVPVAGPRREVVDEEIEIAGERLRMTALSIGNPHCVVHVTNATAALAHRLGPLIERDERFPKRTNVQFVTVLDRHSIRMEIWERGAGYTLASGTSSCAAAAASVRLGLCASEVNVQMPGGNIQIGVTDEFFITMLGRVGKIAEGTIATEFLSSD